MAERYEYYTADYAYYVYIYASYWRGQTFTPLIGHKITSVKLKMFRKGSPGTLTVSIRATDAAGKPTGADLCVGTINGNTFTYDFVGAWYEIALGEGTVLNAGVKYAIVIRSAGSSSSNSVCLKVNPTGTYPRGHHVSSSNGGGTWGISSAYDSLFEEWGVPAFPTQCVGLKARIGGVTKDLCLVAEGDSDDGLRIKKGGTTYAIYLVETGDGNASPIRTRRGAATKAIRYKT